MVQTYQGYFQEDGQFVSGNTLIKLPVLRRTIVNVLVDEPEREIDSIDNSHQKRVDLILSIITRAQAIENDGMSDEDWDELINIRNNTNYGLSKVVDL